jgi:hypothetical protein
MTEEEREKYYADKRKEYIQPMLDKITSEDGILDLEALAYFLSDLSDDVDELQNWRNS